MAQKNTNDNKSQILKAFQQLLDNRKNASQLIATKEETAERQKDKEVVDKASNYTVESIVKGLADSQLDFGNTIDSVTEKLTKELTKLTELQHAILVTTHQVEELQNIRVAADALDILQQENQEKLKDFEEESTKTYKLLETETNEKHLAWEKEQQEYERLLAEKQATLEKDRKREEEDYKYEVERQRKVEANQYEERKRKLERDLAEKGKEKDKVWQEREKVLAENQPKFEEYKAKVATMPDELEKAVKKAREEAIKETYEAEQVKANLLEKEVAASSEVYDLKIKSLEKTIEQQVSQLTQLTEQLQAGMKQAQELAMKAVQGTSKSNNVNKS
ncbi:MAG: hypothetical protein IPK14_14055 [Blastocatellia bacterium]|nr:hypothetical protein [Blastocatellia bacterium]MBN8725293.1 hypothetical protein [Acidobacteriota bacterium]